MLTNKVNGHRYIGQTQQDDVKQRWRAYKTIKKGSIGTVLFRALTKHGPDNFKFQIICVCFDEDCNKYEVSYIKKYNTMTPNGYNMQDGGKNPSVTCRKKIVLSDEQKEKLRGRFANEKSPNFGKTMSDEQKAKIGKSLKEFHANKDKSSQVKVVKKKPVWREVEKYDANNTFIERFETLSAAAKSVNTSYHMILKYATEGILYKGFYWKATEKEGIPVGLEIGREMRRKQVSQYTLDNKLIATYPSFSEAARAIDGCVSYIAKCADEREKYKNHQTHKGFIWKLVQ